MRTLLVLCALPVLAFSQTEGRSTVSLGAGAGFPAGGYRTDQFSTGAAISGNYEFRLFKFLAPSIGLVNQFPKYTTFGRNSATQSRERVSLLSLGVRGILPLANNRVELFAGPNATRIWSSETDLTQGFQSPSWLLGLEGGGRLTLDHKHRFWLGPTLRYSRDTGRPTEEWLSLTADFGLRF